MTNEQVTEFAIQSFSSEVVSSHSLVPSSDASASATSAGSLALTLTPADTLVESVDDVDVEQLIVPAQSYHETVIRHAASFLAFAIYPEEFKSMNKRVVIHADTF